MNKLIHQPFDKLVKATLQKEKKALEFFRTYIPDDILSHIDLDEELTLVNHEFIKNSMVKLHSDVLYKTRVKNKSGYIYCHVEAQSTPDELLPLRMLAYNLEIMIRHFKDHREIPPIVNLLIYNGSQTPYPYPVDFLELLDLNPLAKQCFFAGSVLIDVSSKDEPDIWKNPEIGFMEWLLKRSRGKDFPFHLQSLIDRGIFEQQIQNSDSNYIEQVFLFIVHRLKETTQNKQEFMEAIRTITPYIDPKDIAPCFDAKDIIPCFDPKDVIPCFDAKDIVPCLDPKDVIPCLDPKDVIPCLDLEPIFQEKKEEGKQEGREEGKQEGREEGREEGERDMEITIAKNMLAQGTNKDFISLVTGLSISEIEKFEP